MAAAAFGVSELAVDSDDEQTHSCQAANPYPNLLPAQPPPYANCHGLLWFGLAC
jgi:hypothetical protein